MGYVSTMGPHLAQATNAPSSNPGKKYMGGYEIASYVLGQAVPQISDYNHGFDATLSTRTRLLTETLDRWMEFLHNYGMYEHEVSREDHATFRTIKKLRSRPREFRSSPYKITRATVGKSKSFEDVPVRSGLPLIQ